MGIFEPYIFRHSHSHWNHSHSHSHSRGNVFSIPIPMGFPWESHSHGESHSHAHLYLGALLTKVELLKELHLTAKGCHLPYGITQRYLPPEEVKTSGLNPDLIYLPWTDGRLSWLYYTYWDGLPTHRWSFIQVLTPQCNAAWESNSQHVDDSARTVTLSSLSCVGLMVLTYLLTCPTLYNHYITKPHSGGTQRVELKMPGSEWRRHLRIKLI